MIVDIKRNCAGLALGAGLLFGPATAEARINMASLPGRDSVQLTIYNAVDLTMVRETRFLTLRKGINRLEFSWANTLIDPTSVEFKALTHGDEVEVEDASFPPRVTNTLEWRVRSDFAGEVEVEIRYFTSGINWSADYVAEAARDEKTARLAGFVKVSNHSGEDYENAQVRLIVGTIHLVENIAGLAGQQPPEGSVTTLSGKAAQRFVGRFGGGGFGFGGGGGAMKDIVKEGLSEYFLYTVEGRDTIATGWSKRLPSFDIADVPISSYYKFEREKWGDQPVRFYKFKNAKESRLGNEPLPNGVVQAFRQASDDRLNTFAGRAEVKYIPIGEEVELPLGTDPEVEVKARLTDWRKSELSFNAAGNVTGWTLEEDWEIEAQDAKEIGATVDIRRNFAGDWSLTSDTAYEKVEAGKVKFILQLKPREKRTIHYTVTTRQGTNGRR